MASFRGGDEGSAEDDAIVVASGTVEFVVQLSSALSLITLLPGGTGPCDVMVKAKDGWKDKSTVSALVKRAVPGAAISLRGRLERWSCPPAGECVHPFEIDVGGVTFTTAVATTEEGDPSRSPRGGPSWAGAAGRG